MSFKEGSLVQVQSDIGTPKYEWGNVRPGEIGRVVKVVDAEHIVVDFPSQKNWNADPADLELASMGEVLQHMFASGVAEQVEIPDEGILQEESLRQKKKDKRKSPEKLLGYGVILRDGKLHSATHDREIARARKAKLGGKQKGVTIVVLKPGKEIR